MVIKCRLLKEKVPRERLVFADGMFYLYDCYFLSNQSTVQEMAKVGRLEHLSKIHKASCDFTLTKPPDFKCKS